MWLGVLRVKVEEYYGAPPLEKMLQVLRLREAMDRYDREWHERSALQDVRQDQDDQSGDGDEHAGTANDASNLDACVGDSGSRTIELDRL